MARVENRISLSGGGSSIIVVTNYSALPDPTTVSGEFYWAESSQGTSWLPGSLGGTYYNSGMYYSNGTAWTFMNVPYQATQEEVIAGINTDKFVTPFTLKGVLPTNTSDLINDGEDGVHPYITLLDLPSNLILYPTTVASDVVGYVKLVTDIHDVDYEDPAVNVSTGSITTTNQLISSLITVPDLISGNPGVFNISTVGNIRRSAGSGTAEFYFNVYKRDSLGTETLIGTSNPTLPVNNGVYAEFNATAIWDDGVFTATDRIVLKFYGSRISGGSDPTYEFQFGGTTPVRTLVPIPLSVVPSIPNATETVAGIAEIATTAEVTTGTDDTRIVTPLKLKAVTDLKVNSSTATTGSVISFDTAKIYNTFTTPTTADITNDLTGAKIGVVQKIYSNKAVAPTYPLGWVKIGGDYTASVVNIIYAEWSEGSRVEYWIIKG